MRVWLSVTCICCIIHIITLSIQYTEYEISTSVEVQFRDRIQLPDLTICHHPLVTANWNNQKLHNLCNHIIDLPGCRNMTASEMHQKIMIAASTGNFGFRLISFLRKFTIGEILKDVTIPVDQYIIKHSAFDEEAERVSIVPGYNKSFHIYDSMVIKYRCRSFQWKDNSGSIDYWMRRRSNAMTDILALKNVYFNKNLPVKVTFNRHGSPPSMLASEFLTTYPMSMARVYSFQHYESILLPAPYRSRCVDYADRSSGTYDTRGECFESCYGMLIMNATGGRPLVARNDMSHSNMKIAVDGVVDVIKMRKYCAAKCINPECHQDIYVTKVVDSINILDDLNYYPIFTVLPSSPTIWSKSFPAISFELFITNVCSTFGFWMGISVLSFIDIVSNVSRTVKEYICKLSLKSGFLFCKRRRVTHVITLRPSPPNLLRHAVEN